MNTQLGEFFFTIESYALEEAAPIPAAFDASFALVKIGQVSREFKSSPRLARSQAAALFLARLFIGSCRLSTQSVLNKYKGCAEQMATRTNAEIRRGIRSFQKQIKLHEDKIRNPRQHMHNWDSMCPEEQKSLLQRWPNDIARHQEQKSILEGILRERHGR